MPPKKTRILEKGRVPGSGFRLVLEYSKTFPQPVYIATLQGTKDISKTVVYPKCSECGGSLTKVEKTGEIVCIQCGLVQEGGLIVPSSTQYEVSMGVTKEITVKFDASIPEKAYALYEKTTKYRNFNRARVLLLLRALESIGVKSYPTVAIAEVVDMAWTTASTRLYEMVHYQKVLTVTEAGVGGLLRVDDPLSPTGGVGSEWTAPLSSNYYSLTHNGRREADLLIKSTLSDKQLEIFDKFGKSQNVKGKILVLLAISETPVSSPDLREIIAAKSSRAGSDVVDDLATLLKSGLIRRDVTIEYAETPYDYYGLMPDGLEEAEKMLTNSLFVLANVPQFTIGLPLRMLEPTSIEPRSRETGFVMKREASDKLTESEIMWYLEREWQQTPKVVDKLHDEYIKSRHGVPEFKNEWWRSVFSDWPVMSLEKQIETRGLITIPQTVWVQITGNVKKFKDEKVSYGPFREGALRLVPINIASMLIKQKKAITMKELKERTMRFNVVDKKRKILNDKPLRREEAETLIRSLTAKSKELEVGYEIVPL